MGDIARTKNTCFQYPMVLRVPDVVDRIGWMQRGNEEEFVRATLLRP